MKESYSVVIVQKPADEAEVRFKHGDEEFVMCCSKNKCMFLAAYLMLRATRVSQDVIDQCELWGRIA